LVEKTHTRRQPKTKKFLVVQRQHRSTAQQNTTALALTIIWLVINYRQVSTNVAATGANIPSLDNYWNCS